MTHSLALLHTKWCRLQLPTPYKTEPLSTNILPLIPSLQGRMSLSMWLWKKTHPKKTYHMHCVTQICSLHAFKVKQTFLCFTPVISKSQEWNLDSSLAPPSATEAQLFIALTMRNFTNPNNVQTRETPAPSLPAWQSSCFLKWIYIYLYPSFLTRQLHHTKIEIWIKIQFPTHAYCK